METREDSEMPEFDFGAPFGKQRCTPMFMEEFRGLPDEIPSLRSTGFYSGGFGAVVDCRVPPTTTARHEDAYALTAISAAACPLQYLDGSMASPAVSRSPCQAVCSRTSSRGVTSSPAAFCEADSSRILAGLAAEGGPHAHARRTRPRAHPRDRGGARRRRGCGRAGGGGLAAHRDPAGDVHRPGDPDLQRSTGECGGRLGRHRARRRPVLPGHDPGPGPERYRRGLRVRAVRGRLAAAGRAQGAGRDQPQLLRLLRGDRRRHGRGRRLRPPRHCRVGLRLHARRRRLVPAAAAGRTDTQPDGLFRCHLRQHRARRRARVLPGRRIPAR